MGSGMSSTFKGGQGHLPTSQPSWEGEEGRRLLHTGRKRSLGEGNLLSPCLSCRQLSHVDLDFYLLTQNWFEWEGFLQTMHGLVLACLLRHQWGLCFLFILQAGETSPADFGQTWHMLFARFGTSKKHSLWFLISFIHPFIGFSFHCGEFGG